MTSLVGCRNKNVQDVQEAKLDKSEKQTISLEEIEWKNKESEVIGEIVAGSIDSDAEYAIIDITPDDTSELIVRNGKEYTIYKLFNDNNIEDRTLAATISNVDMMYYIKGSGVIAVDKISERESMQCISKEYFVIDDRKTITDDSTPIISCEFFPDKEYTEGEIGNGILGEKGVTYYYKDGSITGRNKYEDVIQEIEVEYNEKEEGIQNEFVDYKQAIVQLSNNGHMLDIE